MKSAAKHLPSYAWKLCQLHFAFKYILPMMFKDDCTTPKHVHPEGEIGTQSFKDAYDLV